MPNILQDATTTMHKEVYSDDQGGVLFHLNISFYLPEKDCVDPFSKSQCGALTQSQVDGCVVSKQHHFTVKSDVDRGNLNTIRAPVCGCMCVCVWVWV